MNVLFASDFIGKALYEYLWFRGSISNGTTDLHLR